MKSPEPPVLKYFIKKYSLTSYGDYWFYKYPHKRGHLHGYTFAYRHEEDGKITLLASLSDHLAFTRIELNHDSKNISLCPEVEHLFGTDKLHLGDFTLINAAPEEAFRFWAEKMELPAIAAPKTTGYTSWYSFYENISEEKLNAVLSGFIDNKIPIEYFQIDDGYQTHVGDWFSLKNDFPHGLLPLTTRIHAAGYKAGLWLAPLAAAANSDLVRQNPHWIATHPDGSFVKAGSNWGGFYTLNFYLPEVKLYLSRVFEHVQREWKFDLVKLDFLYAAAMVPYPGKTKAAKMYDAMQFLREISGEMKILACGVPFASAFGTHSDYCRIGPDVGLEWESLKMLITRLRERVSTKNTLHNTINRYWLGHGLLGNDPDVFLLREHDIQLKQHQKFTLYLTNQIFGRVLFTSDDISQYAPQTMRLYKMQFPQMELSVHDISFTQGLYTAHLMVGQHPYLFVFNSGNKSARYTADASYSVCAGNVPEFFLSGEKIKLKPHQSMLLYKIPDEPYAIAGSTLHLFGANAIAQFSANENHIQYTPKHGILTSGQVFIKVPTSKTVALCNSKTEMVHFNKIYYISVQSSVS